MPLEGNHSQICRIRDEGDPAFCRIVEECQKIGTDMSGALRSRSLVQLWNAIKFVQNLVIRSMIAWGH